MTSAKVIIKEQDRSAIVPAFEGVYAGVVVVSEKGPVGKPQLITNENQLIDVYGTPNPRLGVSMYSAMNYLSQGNKLWVVRAAHDDSKHSAVLVRSKIAPVPQGKTATLSNENLIVRPLSEGLDQESLDSYSFPVYRTNKLYAAVAESIFEGSEGQEVRVDALSDLAVGDSVSFTTETLSALNSSDDTVGEDTPTYQITNTVTRTLTFDNAIVDTPLDVAKGDQVLKVLDTGDTEAYAGSPTVVRTATSTTNILLSNADYIAPGDTIEINGVQAVFQEKTAYNEEAKFIELDAPVIVTETDTIFKVEQSEFEERDAFLVVAANAGRWGNHLSIAITPSRDYEQAFNIIVYYKGVQVESWEVTRDPFLDGFGRQMQLEQKVNGKSAYIKVVNNDANVDDEGSAPKPLVTDYSLWRQDAEDIFVDSGNTVTENILKGHVEVKLDLTTNLELGTRVKFLIGDDFELSKEYKVQSLDSNNNTVTLDRPIEEDEIPVQWIDSTGSAQDTKLYWFDASINNEAEGIVNGVQYFPISKVDRVFYNYPINARFVISGQEGTLLSAGANMTTGGSLGSTATVGDLIRAIKMLSNKESTPVTLLMDGGFTVPAFAQAVDEVAENQGLTHGYLSVSQDAEESVDYLSAIVDYKNSTNLNTHRCSMFTGWTKVYDEYNQLEVWVSPEGFAAAAQSFTTRNYNMWYPAAGWTRGMVRGLDVKVKFSEGDRDFLVDNRINPIRHRDGSGLVIWGNETLLVKPSPMQLRSVSMLLIVIKQGLENMLEYKTFDLNNERTWSIVEGTLNGFMRDEIQSKGGVYAYEVAVQEVITESDIDNRRMPVFLGIQPTMDIKTIPVTLAIFNSSVDIDVAL